jgi:phosphoglycolate phosphatase-like HAD superfamily hydrolase
MLKKENAHVYLDFDGVLFDTAREAYAVLCFVGKVATTIDAITFDSPQYKIFSSLRPYVGPAWNYFYVHKEIERQDVSRDKVVRYLNAIAKASQKEYQEFEKEFFATRADVQKRFKDEWLNLNRPYPFLFMIAPFLRVANAPYSIVTTKDLKTVDLLLKKSGISFQNDNIFDKIAFDKLKSKASIIDDHMRKNNITKALLIDDSACHIQECKRIINLETVIPDWGYIIETPNSHSKEAVFDLIYNLTKG